MSDLKFKINSIATKVGFTHFGVAEAAPLNRGRENLIEWLDGGYHGSMEWMERDPEKRSDPTKYMPGAKSVISLGLNYYTQNGYSGDSDKGKISRYAWGDDYHDIIDSKLKIMIDELKKFFPYANFKACCDTAPVMEKEWAQKAGIGWIGKNTNLLTKQTGSWLFLAEIISDLEIEPDTPALDYCGSCTLCIDHCPTKALVEPYKLDARLCISYLTIEHRGEFSDNAPSYKEWIYGCDICQDVCPWNNFQSETEEISFQPRGQGTEIELEYAAKISDEGFKKVFAGSPILRTKAEGLRRNAEFLKSES